MKIVFKEPEEEEEEEHVYFSSLEVGTLFKLREEVFFVSSDAASKKKLMTCLNTGITYSFDIGRLDKKDIIETSTLIIEW